MEVRTLLAAQLGILVADGHLLGKILRETKKPRTLSFPLGSHLEPWMYQLPLVLNAVTAVGLLLIQPPPMTEPARSADGVPRGGRG